MNMIAVMINLVCEDEPGLDHVLKSIERLIGVESVDIVPDTYHEYNIDSDPFWEEEE